MAYDMITIYNRLTCKELGDYRLFKYVLNDNYGKFKYLYSMIRDIDFDNIDTVECNNSDDDLFEVRITVTNNNYLNELLYAINSRRKEYKKANEFILDLSEVSSVVILKIYTAPYSSNKDGDNYYGDRSV